MYKYLKELVQILKATGFWTRLFQTLIWNFVSNILLKIYFSTVELDLL